ncbi:MAG: flavin-dependent monooxygenase [Steroidobacteraceae bacterium]|jgi:3-hydroxy-9,10-secoandrosta-1,3,5(10)-triene-9,17-dione monooxygenase
MATAAAHVLDDQIPSREELVRRARAMLPALKARQSEAYAARRLPAETVREMIDAGFFRILQPKRYGGYEMDPQVFFDVQMTVAEACMSTAWVLGVVGCHPYQLALFDDRAQQEVWGNNPDTLVSSSYQPVGKVEVVEGGFRLSGRWGFSSGSEYCDWVLLGSLIFPESGPPEMRTFLLPRKDYKIVDNWHTFGLQATGSQDIVVENAFIPEYRTHKATDGFNCTNPGQAVNTGPLYKLPWAQVFVRSVSTGCIGGVQGALNAFVDIGKKRVSTNTGKATRQDGNAIQAAARTQSAIDEMKAVLYRNFDEMMDTMRSGGELTLEQRIRYRYQSSQVGRRCADLIDDLMPLLGGRAIYTDSPIIRYWLDTNAARAHVANDPNLIGASLGGMYMGEQPQDTFV